MEKTNDNAFSKTNRLNKTLTPLKKIQISKERFDQVTKEHFVKQLNELHPAQKEIIEQALLKKFVDFEHKNRLKAAQEEEKARQAKLLKQSKFNEQERENIKKSEEFRRQWEAEHLEKWAANRSIRQTQVAKDEQYRSKLETQKMQSRTMSEMNAMRALDNDIATFERKNLNRIPNDSDSDKEEEAKLTKTPSEKPELAKPR